AGMLLAALANGFGQPVITTQPQNQTNVLGSTTTFSVVAMGTPPLSYQWRSYSGTFVFTEMTGQTNDTLSLSNVQSNAANFKYGVVVSDMTGSVTSVLVRLTVVQPPSITAQPTNFLTMSLGASVSNRVTASSPSPVSYQWQLNGTNLPGQT